MTRRTHNVTHKTNNVMRGRYSEALNVKTRLIHVCGIFQNIVEIFAIFSVFGKYFFSYAI